MKEAQECSQFHPTKEELILLTKYWAERVLEIESGCGSLVAEHSFASTRAEKIMHVLGEDLFREIIREVEQTRRARHYNNGVPEQEICSKP